MRLKIVFLLALVLLISSCVYYNTFYNAKTYFKDAQEIELKEDGRPASNAIQKYNKAIKKCGIVLEYYEDSKYADDALLLMAKSFFYIGRNYTQTISTLEDMIKFYPQSELVPEATLYIARAKYEFRQEDTAYEMLQEFLINNDFKKLHPDALQILADYKLKENDYVQTDYYLNRLIEEYPDSDKFEEAFYLQGKSQNEAGIYDKSNEIFFKLLRSRVSKTTKFNAKYYIALNYLLLDEYQQAADYAAKLLKDEFRVNKLARIRLILARSYAEMDKIEEAVEILEAIADDNKRSSLSAQAFFFLGEIYFHKLKEYDKSIENYNKVKTEYGNSEYVEDSIFQSAIASQIIQYYSPNSTIAAVDLINQQFKLAEYYIEYLEMPDSALIVYDNIIQQESRFKTALDTMQIQLDSLAIIIDSLVIADSLLQIQIDSLNVANSSLNMADSLLKIQTDSLDFVIDSLLVDDPLPQEIVIPDSSMLVEKERITTRKANLQTEYDSIIFSKRKAEENISLYQQDFIPFAKLTTLWLYKKVLIDSSKVNAIYNELLTDYPDNKYTFAAEQFLAGKDSILITTRKHINETADYKHAIKYLESKPDSTIVNLLPIANDMQHEYREKALYSLGYINYFLLADSLSAKPFLDSVLVNQEHTILKTETLKFYNGENFIKIARLPFIEAMIQAELDEEKAKEKKAKEEKDNEEKEQKESEEIKPSQEIPEEKEKEPDKKSPKEGKD